MSSLGKGSLIINKPNSSKSVFSIPLIIILLIGFFFLSSVKIKIVYSTSHVNPHSNNPEHDASCNIPIEQVEQTKKPSSYPFTIVTASSANHLCSLENFLYSLSHLREEVLPEEFPRIVVYNIGMNRTQLPVLDQLQENGLIDDLVTFDYSKYPRFWDVAINAGEYAWKTGIVYEASTKYTDGLLVWLDAGNVVTPEFIRSIPKTIRQQGGFWSPRSSQKMHTWTHPGLYKYYNADPDQYAQNRNCNGAALGFDPANQTIVNGLIKPWYQCGLDKNCIAPPGSSRANHRQDQAALTFLAYRGGYQCTMSPNYYKLQTHRDKSCRSELLSLDIQGSLYHPSSIDLPRWYPSNTLQLYHHPEWRYAEDKIPKNLEKLLSPPPFVH